MQRAVLQQVCIQALVASVTAVLVVCDTNTAGSSHAQCSTAHSGGASSRYQHDRFRLQNCWCLIGGASAPKLAGITGIIP